jgi:hypothetical protein
LVLASGGVAAGAAPFAITGSAILNWETSMVSMTTIGKKNLILLFILFLLSITYTYSFLLSYALIDPDQLTLPAVHKVFSELIPTYSKHPLPFVKQKNRLP